MPSKRKQIANGSLEEQLRATTMSIAMVVRNAMEDFDATAARQLSWLTGARQEIILDKSIRSNRGFELTK